MLQQLADSAIPLFGKTISAFLHAHHGSVSPSSSDNRKPEVSEAQTVKGRKKHGGDELVHKKAPAPLETAVNQKILSVYGGTANADNSSSNVTKEVDSDDKIALQKLDKVLQCPRCESMDTKFCYYNNYDVHQPRHFCKGCQRYWTVGGAIRNLPVRAAGRRRKSKDSNLQDRYLTISDTLQASSAVSPNRKAPGQTGKCASTGSVSTFRERPFPDLSRNLAHEVNERLITMSHEFGEINSSGSCITPSNERGSKHPANTSFASVLNDCLAQVFPARPYPHPVSSLPVVPPNYWPCAAIPNAWSTPWLTSQLLPQASSDIVGNLSSDLPVLGKRPWDGEIFKDNSEKQASVLKPKTLRMDNPEEAARSSIWETLGIKNEAVCKGGFLSRCCMPY